MAKAKSRTHAKSAPHAPVAAAPDRPTPAAVPAAPAATGTKVPGVLDSQLRAELHEAHRVLSAGIDAWQKVLDNVEGQFVRPLLNAHDGKSDNCVEVKRQVDAFRSLYQ